MAAGKPVISIDRKKGSTDIGASEGWVNVGDGHDTPAFAVASIARWWERMGRARYPEAARLLITADAGGSNAYRSRMLKAELAKPLTSIKDGLSPATGIVDLW